MKEDKRARVDKKLLAVLDRVVQPVPPVWMMRQAGRYLPEYRATREKAGGFLDLCFNPQLASEVTLQPIKRFGFDAAILFSDILVIPYALGRKVWFVEGEGPRLDPLSDAKALDGVAEEIENEKLEPIYETVRLVKQQLPKQTAFIGFCGAPWTVATYMIAGKGTPDQAPAKELARKEPQAFARLLNKLVDASTDYLAAQLKAGVELVQIFDTWAGTLPPADFERWSVEPTRAIVEKLRAKVPGAKVIGFPRGAGDKFPSYIDASGVNAVSIESGLDPVFVRDEIQKRVPIQGNLSPFVLRAGGEPLDRAVDEILEAYAARPFIFNLGHGILPDTPIGHVERMLKRIGL